MTHLHLPSCGRAEAGGSTGREEAKMEQAWKTWQLPEKYTVIDCVNMAARMTEIARQQQLKRDQKAARLGAAACLYWARRLRKG